MMNFLKRWFNKSQETSITLNEGGLYTLVNDNQQFQILKILKLDDFGVHLRQYSNVFLEQPRSVKESELFIAGFDDEKNETSGFGIGHMPVSYQSFQTWQISFIRQSEVVAEELEGYAMWEEAEGGYF